MQGTGVIATQPMRIDQGHACLTEHLAVEDMATHKDRSERPGPDLRALLEEALVVPAEAHACYRPAVAGRLPSSMVRAGVRLAGMHAARSARSWRRDGSSGSFVWSSAATIAVVQY